MVKTFTRQFSFYTVSYTIDQHRKEIKISVEFVPLHKTYNKTSIGLIKWCKVFYRIVGVVDLSSLPSPPPPTLYDEIQFTVAQDFSPRQESELSKPITEGIRETILPFLQQRLNKNVIFVEWDFKRDRWSSAVENTLKNTKGKNPVLLVSPYIGGRYSTTEKKEGKIKNFLTVGAHITLYIPYPHQKQSIPNYPALEREINSLSDEVTTKVKDVLTFAIPHISEEFKRHMQKLLTSKKYKKTVPDILERVYVTPPTLESEGESAPWLIIPDEFNTTEDARPLTTVAYLPISHLPIVEPLISEEVDDEINYLGKLCVLMSTAPSVGQTVKELTALFSYISAHRKTVKS